MPPDYFGRNDFYGFAAARHVPQRAGYFRQLGYFITVDQLDDGQFYWHAWRHTDRINGGLSKTRDSARQAADSAVCQDASYPVKLSQSVDVVQFAVQR